MKIFICCPLFLILISTLSAQQPVPVMVTAHAVIEEVDTSGQIINATQAKETMVCQLVKPAGRQLLIQTIEGHQYLVDVAATNYKPVALTAPPQPIPVPVAQKPPVAEQNPVPPEKVTTNSLPQPGSGTTTDTLLAKFNTLFGHELFTNQNLWQEDADAVGSRLGWTKDSETEYQSSYRFIDDRPALFLHPENNPSLDPDVAHRIKQVVDGTGKTLINCN